MEEEISRPSSPTEEDDIQGSPELTNKKGKRQSKKSSAKMAEIERRENHIKHLLKMGSLPESINEWLKEEVNEKGYLFNLADKEMERFWRALNHVSEEQISCVLEENKGDQINAVESIIAVINLMEYTSQIHEPEQSHTFQHTAMKLNMFMMHSQDICPPQLQDEICALCEYCCLRKFQLTGDFFLNTFQVLFDRTLKDTTSTAELKPFVKRMWDMRQALGRVNLKAQSCEKIIVRLVKAVTCPAYLSCKEGRQFIAFTLTLDTKLVKKFHQAIKEYLPYCKRAQAAGYGEAFYLAWSMGSSEVKQVLETLVIQNYMTHMFVFPRKKQELSQTGQNVFAILSYFHEHRGLSSFSKTLTELYQPLLWRHLRSGNNIERCNAAEVFLDVYPLERPGSGRAEESSFLEKQQGEMVDLLTDTCCQVRIIAIKGICRRLSSAWSTFPEESLTIIFRNMVGLCNDSLSTVRKTLFDSLPILLNKKESAAYLGRILPSVSHYLHDENEKVRRSFIKLLYILKNMSDPPIRWSKVAPVQHLAVRLKLDGPEVGSDISKILMREMYRPDMDSGTVLYRISKLISVNPDAARKVFAHSSKSLEYKDALRVMHLILLNLRDQIRKKEEAQKESNPVQESEEQEQENSPSPVPKKRRQESREVLQPIDQNCQGEPGQSEEECQAIPSTSRAEAPKSETSEQESETEDNPFNWPDVPHTMVDIVSLLWTLHCKTLTSSEHQSELDDLNLVACRAIPLLLKHYKGSPTYFATIHLASQVPAAKLGPVSTVCSACMSHLKQLSEITPEKEINVIVHSLCAWNRFVDIQDVVLDWLDQGFRCENLNMTNAPTDSASRVRTRRVRFVAAGGKPMLALKILNFVFGHPLNSARVKEKCYNQAYDLYVYMDRIKVLIERRLLGDQPLDSPMLSDEFLAACLYRYAKLILFLHRPEPQGQKTQMDETVVEPFDASTVFSDFVLWATRVVYPMLPEQFGDGNDLSVILLKSVLQASVNLINLMYCTHDTILTISKLVRTLLSSDCSMWFVESGLQVMKQIKEFSEVEYFTSDKGDLMKAVVPALLSRVLQSFSTSNYSKEQVMDAVNNLYEVKCMMYGVIMGIKNVMDKLDFMQTILVLFTDSIVAILVHDIRKLQLLDLVQKVQDLPFLCGVMLNVVTKPTLASLWLKSLPHSISNIYSEDSNVLGAAVSLLHTLVHCELKLPKEDLRAAVQQAYTTVTQFSRESTQSRDTSTFSVEYLDIKKAAKPVLKDLGNYLEMELEMD